MFVQRPHIYASVGQRRPLYGVGINDADYPVEYKDATGKRYRCPYYRVWSSMLERCFGTKLHARRPNYIGCTVEPAWLTFSAFRAWMDTQDWQGRVLDKDLISWACKHYGPDTCLFITPAMNNLLTLRTNHRGALPLGVSRTNIRGYEYFVASCSFYGRQTRLGYFDTPEAAATKYKEAKLAHIAELATAEKDLRIRQALLNLF